MKTIKWDFRDVSLGLKKIREFLLGRPHTLHGRFPPQVSSRTIPPPDIPRGPEHKYSNQYYFKRSAKDSVQPPVVAPIAEGPPPTRDPTKIYNMAGGVKADTVCFASPPTPGTAWWWDGHSYFECIPDPPSPCPPAPCPEPSCPPPCPPPC